MAPVAMSYRGRSVGQVKDSNDGPNIVAYTQLGTASDHKVGTDPGAQGQSISPEDLKESKRLECIFPHSSRNILQDVTTETRAAEPQGESGKRAPPNKPRRQYTIGPSDMYRGNYAPAVAVPRALLDNNPQAFGREFTHMRYCAVTCEPDEFQKRNFTLRQALPEYGARQTELFIVVTMYNEDVSLFLRTVYALAKNIQFLCQEAIWNDNRAWQKVVVCVISDGSSNVDEHTRDVLEVMGVYQGGPHTRPDRFAGEDVLVHLYEYTALKFVNPSGGITEVNSKPPMQIIFCDKVNNKKKINSHRWFFNAFCPILKPKLCVLLDVGTQPESSSLYQLWKAFQDPSVGGACGEVVVHKARWHRLLLNPLVAAQNFEYKMSNILDKPLESIFGYITVLPGAFSAYRYEALRDGDQDKPLKGYFDQDWEAQRDDGTTAGFFAANMYLAEDRIMCWELVSKPGSAWRLQYVKSARAYTDVPGEVPELLSQRRRWLNGSFFAALHAIWRFHWLRRSGHTSGRKCLVYIELVYQACNLVFSWFAVGNYLITFFLVTNTLEDPGIIGGSAIAVANDIAECIYVGLLIMSFVLALGNRPQGSKILYSLAFVGFAVLSAYSIFAGVLLVVKSVHIIAVENGRPVNLGDFIDNNVLRGIVLSITATILSSIFASLLHLELWHFVTSTLQYLLMAPSYVNVLGVYAFANVHDFSWGTKGRTTDNERGVDVVEAFRTPSKQPGNKAEEVIDHATARDKAYTRAIHSVKVVRRNIPKDVRPDGVTRRQDYYRSIRTYVLMVWMLSNLLLVAVVLLRTGSAADEGAMSVVSGYLAALLYAVFFLALIRSIGSVGYVVMHMWREAKAVVVERPLVAQRVGQDDPKS